MFYLAVVLERGDVVGGGLDAQDATSASVSYTHLTLPTTPYV